MLFYFRYLKNFNKGEFKLKFFTNYLVGILFKDFEKKFKKKVYIRFY